MGFGTGRSWLRTRQKMLVLDPGLSCGHLPKELETRSRMTVRDYTPGIVLGLLF